MSKKNLLKIAGAIWLVVGVMLLNMGAHFLLEINAENNQMLLLSLIVFSVVLGQIKGRTVMAKVAARSFDRLLKIERPTTLRDLYTIRDLLVIGFMMLLGMSMKHLGLPPAVRGFIDVAVGVALIQGGLRYFHYSVSADLKA